MPPRGRRTQQRQYPNVNPQQAIDLSQSQQAPQITPEQEVEAEKLMKRKARNQLAVAFAQSMAQGNGDKVINVNQVVATAYDLAIAVLEKSEKLDEADPVNMEILQGLSRQL